MLRGSFEQTVEGVGGNSKCCSAQSRDKNARALASLPRASPSLPKQLGKPNTKCASKSLEGLQRRVPSPDFNSSDVAPVQARMFCQTLLRPALAVPQFSDSTPQRRGGRLLMASARHGAMFCAALANVSRLIVTIDLS